MREDSEDLSILKNNNDKNDFNDFDNLLDGLKDEEKKFFIDNKEMLTELENQTKNISLTDNKVVNAISDIILKKTYAYHLISHTMEEKNIDGSGEFIDNSYPMSISLFQTDTLEKTQKNLNQFILGSNNINNDFLTYPISVNSQKKLSDEEKNQRTKLLSSYLDQLDDFYTLDIPYKLKKYNYNLDFSKMSEEDIESFILAAYVSQDFFKMNFVEYTDYTKNRFDLYERKEYLDKLSLLSTTLSLLVAEECFKYEADCANNNIDIKSMKLFSTLGLFEGDEYRQVKNRLLNQLKFFEDDSKILCDVGCVDKLKVKDLVKDGTKIYLDYFTDLYNDSSSISKAIFNENIYKSIYIDGENLYSFIKQKFNSKGLSVEALKDECAKEFLRQIKRADKVIEYTYINEFNNTYTITPKPLVFKYDNPELTNKYKAVLDKALDTKRYRHKDIIDIASSYVYNYEEKKVDDKIIYPFRDKVMLTSEQRKYNPIVENLVLNYNDKIDQTKDFKTFYNYILNVSNNLGHEKKIEKSILDACDSSPMYNNVEELKEAYKNIYSMYDYGCQILNAVYNCPNLYINVSIRRDLARYFMSLKGETLYDRTKKCLRYCKAMELREKDPNNKDYTLTREITNELLDSFLEDETFDLANRDDIYTVHVRFHQAFIIGEMLLADKEYEQKLKESDPYKYYKFVSKASYYENLYGFTKDDVSLSLGYSHYHDQRKFENFSSFIKVKDSVVETMNVNRNLSALNNVFLSNTWIKNSSVEFKCDMSLYGLYGKNNDLSYKDFSSYDITDLLNKLNHARSRFVADEVQDYDNDGNLETRIYKYVTKEEFALYNACSMFDSFSGLLGTDKFVTEFMCNKNNDLYTFMYKSIYVNDKSIFDIASEYQNTHQNFSLNDIASCVFSKALNNKRDILSIVSTKIENNSLVTHASIIQKNYDELVKRSKEGHNFIVRGLHNIGLWTYKEEKMYNDYKENEENFLYNDILENNEKNFKNNFKDSFNLFKQTVRNKNKNKDLEKENQKVKNIEIEELNKKKVINNIDNNILNNNIINKENVKGKE